MLTKEFLTQFDNPSAEWRFAPVWFLNHRLEDHELVRQIDEMHQNGFGGFILHARHGLLTPYMSEEWLDRIETCCRRARELGMWAWLYDEDNWPSGTASGRVVAEHPEYRMSQAYLADNRAVKGPEKLQMTMPEADEILCVLQVPVDGGGHPRYDSKTWIYDYAPKVRDGVLKVRIPKGDWRLMTFARRFHTGGFFSGYVDTLSPEAVGLFIRYTHDPYAKRLRRYYGKTVKGIFTDEPSAFYADRQQSVPWTPKMIKEFARDHKYTLASALPALFFDVGVETAKFRCDFTRTALRLYIEAFYEPIYKHCDRRKIMAIGHMDSEGELDRHLREQMDFFAVTEKMHYAGLDTLCSTTWLEEHRPKNLIAGKFASSAAHLLQKPRVMNESWGLASAWAVDLEELKHLGDWHVALGINYFMPHAVYYSVEGVRKWECPPDEFYREPYWPHYRKLADYLGRLSMTFAGGRHMAPVAVLYPNRTGWATHSGLDDTDPEAFQQGRQLMKTFDKLSEELLRARLDFDYLPEQLLQKADLAGGRIAVRNKRGKTIEDFQLLVMPFVQVLDRDTARAVEQFVVGGGRVCLVGAKPSAYSETGVDAQASAWIEELLRDHNERVRFFPEVTDELMAHVAGAVFRHASIDPASPDAGNRDIVILHYRRREGDCFFIQNTSRVRSYPGVRVVFSMVASPYLMDAETGEVLPLADFERDDDRTVVTMDFAPCQSHVLVLSAEKEKRVTGRATADERLRLARSRRDLVELAGPWQFTAEKGNYLPLPCFSGEHTHTVSSMNWARYVRKYRTAFTVNARPQWCRLIVDGLMRQERFSGRQTTPVTVALNGTELSGFVTSDHYDRLCFEADVAEQLREGENELTVSSSGGMGEAAYLTQPFVLVGDFSVEDSKVAAPRRELVNGDWAAEGYPFFSGTGILSRKIDLSRFDGRVFIRFEKLAETVEVVVNGKSAGVILWPPYELELTGLLRPGTNDLVLRVTNTSHNLFTREAKPSGLVGRAVIFQGDKSKE